MINGLQKDQTGISLIEALIGLAVMSLGLLAIASLYGDLISSSGQTKARAEAIQLAEERVERFRAEIDREAFEGLVLVGDSESFDGTNADFTITPTVDWADPDRQDQLNVRVIVSWDDARGEANAVSVSSSVAWVDPLISSSIASGGMSSDIVPIPRPTGRAVTGDGGLGKLEGTLEDLDGEEFEFGDGYQVRLEELAEDIGGTVAFEDGNFQLQIDGFPVLTTRNALLGSISGRVFVEGRQQGGGPSSGNDAPPLEGWSVISSDAAFCDVIGDDDENMFSDLDVPYFEYVCFFGQGWFGNIGIVTDSADLASSVCVGDPDPELDAYGSWDDVSVQWSPIRRYRGFFGDENGEFEESFGLGDDGPLFFSEHNFLHANLGGGQGTSAERRTEACRDRVNQLDEDTKAAFSGAFAGIGNSGDDDPSDNPGRNVCLLGPGFCLADDDAGPSVASATLTLRFVNGMGGESTERPEDLLAETLQTDDGTIMCDVDGGVDVDGEWRVECTIDLPDAAQSWPADGTVELRISADEDGPAELYACTTVDRLRKRIGTGGNRGTIQLAHERQGNTRLSSWVEFENIPADELEIVYPDADPENGAGPIPLCFRN